MYVYKILRRLGKICSRKSAVGCRKPHTCVRTLTSKKHKKVPHISQVCVVSIMYMYYPIFSYNSQQLACILQ